MEVTLSIYVIIVTYNGAPWIRGALESLRNSDITSVPLVIDNASSDDTRAIVEREFPEARLVPLTENVGFGRGNNVGISLALREGAGAVFLLNQDAYVTPSALRELSAFLALHVEYAVVSPLHCSPDTSSLDHQTLRGYLQPYASRYLSDACLGTVRDHYEIRGINAAAWMVRADAFKIVGGFDPLYFMYGEDDDLIARFHYLGLSFALLPKSRIVHLRARSPRMKKGLGVEVWSASERARSHLLGDLKSPRGTFVGRMIRLFSEGIAHPFARFLVDHDWKELCAHVLATGRVLVDQPRIARSTRLCATRGPHFLDLAD